MLRIPRFYSPLIEINTPPIWMSVHQLSSGTKCINWI